jgi:CBS domain-containing protein
MVNELDEVTVGAIAIKAPVTVNLETPVSKAVEKMLREKIHHIIAVDKNGKPVGIISAWDILKLTFLSENAKEYPISKLIEGQKLIFVYTEVSLRDALNLMINKGIRAMPVLDEHDKLVGKVSIMTIAQFVKEKL